MNAYFNEEGLAFSSHYADAMNHAVTPYLKAREKAQTVQGTGGKPLHCVSYGADEPRGTVLVMHGFTENAEKFSELFYSLLQNGFSVVSYDQRGHGYSWRDDAVKQDPSLTHVSDFNEYVGDLESVIDTVLRDMPRPWMIFAHSMGGAVASLFLERHPDVISRAALCAPMIAPNTGLPRPAVAALCGAARIAGQGKKRVFISKPYAGPEDFATSCATCRERFDWYDRIKQEHREYWNNGPTYDWTMESLKANRMLLAPGAPEKIDCPVRLYTAEIDGSVMPDAQKQFIERVRQGSHVFVKDAKHEIFRSADGVLFPWWQDVLAFLKEKAQPSR